jgi:hypothetical protein
LSSANSLENPVLNLYVITGEIAPRESSTTRRGFFEVLPAEALGTLEDVVDCVLGSNSPRSLGLGAELVYTLCLSKDELGLNPAYGRNEDPFSKINGSREGVQREHAALGTGSSVKSLPLLEAREVDEKFRFTGRTYALATGDGLLEIENPHLGQRLVIDARSPEQPQRRQEVIPKRAPEAH